jgi:excisionase family DNA binding protein
MPHTTSQTTDDNSATALPVKRRAYTIKEVCREYDISAATIYRMRDRGLIRIIKIGGASRILEEDLLKLEKGVA